MDEFDRISDCLDWGKKKKHPNPTKPQIRSDPNRNKTDRMNTSDEFGFGLVRMSSDLDDISNSDGISDWVAFGLGVFWQFSYKIHEIIIDLIYFFNLFQ